MDSFKCLICGSSNFNQLNEKVRDSHKHYVVDCIDCNHVQLHPIPTLEDDKEFYNKDRQAKAVNQHLNFDEIKRKSESDLERRKKHVNKLIKANDWMLDVGAGYGFFVKEMEQDNHLIEGIEISQERREIASHYCDSSIYNINLLSDGITESIHRKYNVVTLFQVLEHIIQPEKFLVNLKSLLKDNGRILIEVPNVNDHLLHISEEYCQFFWQRAHVSYFSAEILTSLLHNCGYKEIEVCGIQRYSLENMMNWVTAGKPQLKKPSHDAQIGLQWLDDYYKKSLCERLESDTLVVTAKR